jgi:hypothetical protein
MIFRSESKCALVATFKALAKAELEMPQTMRIMQVNNNVHQVNATPAYAEVNQYSTSTVHS